MRGAVGAFRARAVGAFLLRPRGWVRIGDSVNVLLINVDCRWNLAIRRLWAYHERRGDHVEVRNLEFGFYPHKNTALINASAFDVVYVSNIFETNANRVCVQNCDNVNFGGVGSKNPGAKLPPEVENTPPHYEPDEDTAHGFITRGCIRHCSFCKVPEHEGVLRAYKSVQEVVGGFKKAIFYDNNILAWDGAAAAFDWLADNNIRCTFNQGLDIRLITDDLAAKLARLNYAGEYIFALDDVRLIPLVEKKLKVIKKYIPQDWRLKFYVYVCDAMPISDTVKRIEFLKDHKCLPYVMRDQDVYRTGSAKSEFYTDLAAWCNQPAFFKKTSFDCFLDKRHANNPARGGRSYALYKGDSILCESCWGESARLFEDETGNNVCASCLEMGV